MRLIDADALEKNINGTCSLKVLSLDNLFSIIDNAPTIDAVPVRHGEWEEVRFRTIPYNRIAKAKKCSSCGKQKDKYVVWNYCPNCGAKMDEEETNE